MVKLVTICEGSGWTTCTFLVLLSCNFFELLITKLPLVTIWIYISDFYNICFAHNANEDSFKYIVIIVAEFILRCSDYTCIVLYFYYPLIILLWKFQKYDYGRIWFMGIYMSEIDNTIIIFYKGIAPFHHPFYF